jgi:hypothetical protein
MNQVRIFYLPVVLAGIVLLFTGCAPKQNLPTDDQRLEARNRVRCIAVLPVEIGTEGKSDMSFEEAAILQDGAAFMGTLIRDQLMGNNHVRLLSSQQYTSLLPANLGSETALLKTIGAQLDCTGVMRTTLFRYDQRIGGSFGVTRPASVSFAMHLVNIADGTTLWRASFEETQQSVLENVFTPSRGLRWLTVEELLDIGVTETLARSPYFESNG